MNREELEALLIELDNALVKAFPGPETISVFVVGGACLLFSGISTRPTRDIDVIITDLMGTGTASLVYNLNETTGKIRKIIEKIGRNHGLRGNDKWFLNDDCASFLIEMGSIPPSRLLRSYQKLHLYIPDDLSYILACKLAAGRADKDYGDIEVLCELFNISARTQAQEVVDRFFHNHAFLEDMCDLSRNLDEIFGKD